MSKIRWRKLKGDEVVEVGDILVHKTYDMNYTTVRQIRKWMSRHDVSNLPVISVAYGVVGYFADSAYFATTGLRVWRPEIAVPKCKRIPQPEERKIQLDL